MHTRTSLTLARRIALLLILAIFSSLIVPIQSIQAANGDADTDNEADVVTGQFDFTLRENTNPPTNLNAPTGVAIGDTNFGLPGVFALVADRDNNRVLLFDLTTLGQALNDSLGVNQPNNLPTLPDVSAILGQVDLTTVTPGTTQSTLRRPTGVAFAPLKAPATQPSLFVADSGNNRVLRFNAPGLGINNADLVLGQNGFTDSNPGAGLGQLNNPQGVAVDKNNRVYVADTGNNRVLVYTNPTTNGAAASFSIGGVLGSGATQLNQPTGIAVDADGNLYVADTGNNRVLKYNAPLSNGMAASKVYGQPGFGNSAPGTSATTMRGPTGVAVDSLNNLYVADKGNNRALLFFQRANNNDTTADKVFGQGNSFTSGQANIGGTPNYDTLNEPTGIAVNPNSRASVDTDYRDLFVADTNNHRVLQYWTPTPNPAPTLTVPTFAPISGTATVGVGADVTVTINGQDFASGASVIWNGLTIAPPAATVLSARQLRVTVPGALFDALDPTNGVPTAGLPVTVANPLSLRFQTPPLIESNDGLYPVCFPKPAIGTSGKFGISPAETEAGSAGFTLTITGTNFIGDLNFPMQVYFGGEALAGAIVTEDFDPINFPDIDQLTIDVPASALSLPGTASISLTNFLPDPAGVCATFSASTARTIKLLSPAPIITGFSPATVQVNPDEPVDIVINGFNFITEGPFKTVVEFGNPAFAGTVVISNSSQILLQDIPASFFATAGNIPVKVKNPPTATTDGGEDTDNFPVSVSGRPVIKLPLNPASIVAGSPAFLLTIVGTDFSTGPEVTWYNELTPDNKQLLRVIDATDTEVVVLVPAQLVEEAGVAFVAVDDPTDALPASVPERFFINNPRPVIERLDPASSTPGVPAFTMTVLGRDFINGAQVSWAGTDLTTTFVSASELRAEVPANLVASPGTFSVVVNNPEPNFGPSVPFNVVVSAKDSPELRFNPVADRSLVASPVTVTVTSESDGAITFESATPDICVVDRFQGSSATVSLKVVGTCTIQATQAETTQYAPGSTLVNFEVTEGFRLYLPILFK